MSLFLVTALFLNSQSQDCESADITPIALRTDFVYKNNYFGYGVHLAFGMSDIGSFEVGTQISPLITPYYNALLLFKLSDLWWSGVGGQMQNHMHVYMENRLRLLSIMEDNVSFSLFHRFMHKDNPSVGVNFYIRLQ